jgi:uncharacterized protein YciI
MRFAAVFFDDLDPSQVAPDLTKQHFDYLRDHVDKITSAGGLRTEVGGPFRGSLWVIEATDIGEARRLADGDPYCVAGLRPDRRVFIWNHAPIPKA